MASNKVAIATTTFYKNHEEGRLRKNLAMQFMRAGVERRYEIYAVDGGTDDGKFIYELNDLGVNAYAEKHSMGLGESRREAVDHASSYAVSNKIPYLSWSEPEKVDLIRNISGLVEKMDEYQADMVVPSRISLDSYPLLQQLTEKLGNQIHCDHGYFGLNGVSVDTFFGPRL